MVTGWFVLNSVGTVWDFFGTPWTIFDEWIAGGFSRYDANQVADAFSPVTAEGSCRVYSYSGTWWDSLLRGAGATGLDAGPHLLLENSGGEDWQAVRKPGNSYFGAGFLDLYTGQNFSACAGVRPSRSEIRPILAASTFCLT